MSSAVAEGVEEAWGFITPEDGAPPPESAFRCPPR